MLNLLMEWERWKGKKYQQDDGIEDEVIYENKYFNSISRDVQRVTGESIIKRALEKNLLEINVINIEILLR